MEDRELTEPTQIAKEVTKAEVDIYGTLEHYVVSALGTAPPEFDQDWNDHECEDVWRFLCEKRNQLMKNVLLSGKPIQYRNTSRSLEPTSLP